MDILRDEYILENLMKLASNNICCVFFLGPFYDIGNQVCAKISGLQLKIQNHILNGHPIKRIYNLRCCHCIDIQRPFHFTEQSKKDILYHLKHCGDDGFFQDVLPPSLFKSSRLTPVLPANRFSIAPLRPNTFHSDTISREMVPKTWRLYPFKQAVLEKIKENRVLVINGDAILEKSTSVPLTIVEELTAKDSYCKILCVESDNLMAITNSNFIANHLKERIGSRVGFQVYLQSRVCDNTNIIYTTGAFFLRVLMGQDSKDGFRYITHVILSDVHLHNAYKDIFMKELKSILPHYPHIKIILLSDSCDNQSLLSYFGEGQEFCINIKLYKSTIYHLEDIIELIKGNKFQKKSLIEDVFSVRESKYSEIVDNALEYYNKMGNETALNNFMLLVNKNIICVNHPHSKDGYTALIAAIKHDNPVHVRWLLTCENKNPFYQDKLRINALEYAISINSYNCMEALTENVANYEPKPPSIDFDLIIKLLHYITTYWEFGNILIFLPSYEHLLKLNYTILKTQFLGKIEQEICIHLLYANMQPEQLQQILLDKATAKIILATEVAECLSFLNDITYVIDSGQIFREKYSSEFRCNESINEWVSQQSLQRRSLIASRFRDGYCFRMVSRELLSKLQPICPPELHYIPINRISLTVKLLRPGSMVTQYFQDTIMKPPTAHIEHSIEFLKDIESLDSALEVTWLGCRLIDVPINLELGKSLVMSILFRCLDPVLTIISFLTYSSSFKMLKNKISDVNLNYFHWIAESFSDQLEYLRLYQTWQDEKRTKIASDVISDEETFILNGILENVCEIRTNLVGALRSSQLIHNQGLLSMHSINLKANNWAIIKAAIAGGLYPNFCMKSSIDCNIKSKSSKLCMDSASNLHPTNLRTVKSSPLSDWIVYFKKTSFITFSSISNCTLISSATVALFAGKTEMNPNNLFFMKDQAAFFIDENIWLVSDIQTALLAFRLRQRFYAAYLNYLQTCANTDKWRKPNEIPHVFDVISKILLEEDKNAGFSQPNRVGNRPKALANKFFTTEFEFSSNFNNSDLTTNNKTSKSITQHQNYDFLEKEFFLINIFDSYQSLKSFWNVPRKNITNDPHLKTVIENASKDKLIYVLVYSATQKRITHIALIKCEDEEFWLRNCFKVNIPLHEVIIICTALKISLPSFWPDWIPHKIDKAIGEIILDLW